MLAGLPAARRPARSRDRRDGGSRLPGRRPRLRPPASAGNDSTSVALSMRAVRAVEPPHRRVGDERDARPCRARAPARARSSHGAEAARRRPDGLRRPVTTTCDGRPRPAGARHRAGFVVAVVRFVGLDDLLHERVADDVALVEVDRRDALDAGDHLQRLDQPGHRVRAADRSA